MEGVSEQVKWVPGVQTVEGWKWIAFDFETGMGPQPTEAGSDSYWFGADICAHKLGFVAWYIFTKNYRVYLCVVCYIFLFNNFPFLNEPGSELDKKISINIISLLLLLIYLFGLTSYRFYWALVHVNVKLLGINFLL